MFPPCRINVSYDAFNKKDKFPLDTIGLGSSTDPCLSQVHTVILDVIVTGINLYWIGFPLRNNHELPNERHYMTLRRDSAFDSASPYYVDDTFVRSHIAP